MAETGVRLANSQSVYLAMLVLVPMVVSALLVFIAGKQVIDRSGSSITIHSELGHPQWDFSGSFATNLVVIGSVLGVILGAQVLPSTSKVLPSATFAVLSVFFGILVLVAPLFYNGSMTRVLVHPPNQDASYEYHGRVWSFLLSSAVTFWGLLGSVATAFAALLELQFAGTLSMLALVLLAIVLGAAVLFFLRYAWVSVGGTIKDQLDAEVKSARLAQVRAARRLTGAKLPAAEEVLVPPLPRWRLL